MVTDNSVTFRLDNLSYIIITAERMHAPECCRDCTVELVMNDPRYLLYEHDLSDALNYFQVLLKRSISNSAYIHPSINRDIGLIFNQYIRSITNDTKSDFEEYEIEPGNYDWVGCPNKLWSSNLYDTWLYNKNNSIIMEITPAYPWHFEDPEPGAEFIEYADFIRDYKPILFLEISKETAEQWLLQVDDLLQQIADFHVRMRLIHAKETEQI